MPTVGRRQLIFIPSGWYSWRFAADVAEQTGPYTFLLKDAWYIVSAGPRGARAWPELAKGVGRSQAEFQYYGDITVGPVFGPTLEWEGDLPTQPIR